MEYIVVTTTCAFNSSERSLTYIPIFLNYVIPQNMWESQRVKIGSCGVN